MTDTPVGGHGANGDRGDPASDHLWLPTLGAIKTTVAGLVGIFTIAVAVLLIIMAWPTLRHVWKTAGPKGPTYGTIYVDSPEVYTRERLVNDRFTEEAWLNSQLTRTDDLMKDRKFEGVEGQRVQRTGISFGAAADTSQGTPAPQTNFVEAPIPLDQPTLTSTDLSASPLSIFRDAADYRQLIRTELMRTQLDDRHDIEGNTLYRLNFDATISPGTNTNALALIQVTINEDTDASTHNIYTDLYFDWRQQLQTAVTGAITAQTKDLQRGMLHSNTQIAINEFLRLMLCSELDKIAKTLAAGSAISKSEDPSCGSYESDLDELTQYYSGHYMRAIRNKIGKAFADEARHALRRALLTTAGRPTRRSRGLKRR